MWGVVDEGFKAILFREKAYSVCRISSVQVAVHGFFVGKHPIIISELPQVSIGESAEPPFPEAGACE